MLSPTSARTRRRGCSERFVVPAAPSSPIWLRWTSLNRDGRLTVAIPGADSGATLLKNLDDVLTLIGKLPVAGVVDMLEFRWPAELVTDFDDSRLGNLVQAAAGQIVASRLPLTTMFFELPRPAVSADVGACDAATAQNVRAAVGVLAEFNQTARSLNCLAGFKLRCGGTGPGEIPSSAEVALAICACRDAGVFWKGTAGLHHPLRHIDPTWHVPVHGFLNLLCAAVLADIHGFDERQTQAVIDEDDFAPVRSFSDESLVWREFVVTADQVAAARERSLRSFGSCSFDEPCQDLKNLGLL